MPVPQVKLIKLNGHRLPLTNDFRRMAMKDRKYYEELYTEYPDVVGMDDFRKMLGRLNHTARTKLANSEFIVMLNQASTDRLELAKLLNISDLQMSYITNVDAGSGLIKVGNSLVPFTNKFPRNTKLYSLMTTKPGEQEIV